MTTLNASRRLSLVLMLVLAMLAVASPRSVSAATFVNGDFEGYRGCNLTGWTQTVTGGGSVGAMTHDAAGLPGGSDCVAKVHVFKSGTGASTASLKQTFTLESAGWIGFYLYAHSSNGAAPGVFGFQVSSHRRSWRRRRTRGRHHRPRRLALARRRGRGVGSRLAGARPAPGGRRAGAGHRDVVGGGRGQPPRAACRRRAAAGRRARAGRLARRHGRQRRDGAAATAAVAGRPGSMARCGAAATRTRRDGAGGCD